MSAARTLPELLNQKEVAELLHCHPPPSWDHPSATSMGPPRPPPCRSPVMLPDRPGDVNRWASLGSAASR